MKMTKAKDVSLPTGVIWWWLVYSERNSPATITAGATIPTTPAAAPRIATTDRRPDPAPPDSAPGAADAVSAGVLMCLTGSR